MNDILGAAFLIASVAVLHGAKWAISQNDSPASVGRSLLGEVAAISFAGLFAVGLILLANELAQNLDALHVAELVGTLAAAYLLARQLGAALRRAEARRHIPAAAAMPH